MEFEEKAANVSSIAVVLIKHEEDIRGSPNPSLTVSEARRSNLHKG